MDDAGSELLLPPAQLESSNGLHVPTRRRLGRGRISNPITVGLLASLLQGRASAGGRLTSDYPGDCTDVDVLLTSFSGKAISRPLRKV